MCQFKSAIVLRDEREKGGFRLLYSPWTESHSELEIIFKLNVDKRDNRAKVEFTPSDMAEAYKPETYTLKIDEARTPSWFSDDMKTAVADRFRDYIKSIVVTGDVCLLVGGQFIVAPDARIQCAHSMVIAAICGGTVNEIRGGTVNEIWGGTVNEIRGGTVNEIRGGTVNEIRGGTVNAIRGGTVNTIWGGTVNEIWGGTVNEIRGGTVNEIRGGTVNEIRGGTVNEIRGGTVNAIRGGTVNAIWGGTVNEIWGGTVNEILGGTVKKDNRPKGKKK